MKRLFALAAALTLLAACKNNPTSPFTEGASCMLISNAPWQAPGQDGHGYTMELCRAPSGDLTVAWTDWKGHYNP